eukprot:gnl/TRDRNA2_/TRDRNA2_39260_c0_seq1.p1 gnl/TRDRNA2_/TRDRNA2_39260_c0~~gnl/TRDRNA2_/TRDRNA2_39260_c0_seq1.p1  ORF type:complete len:283 (+),score=25.83 gnl/TRDRNA2_/TRDRNA2_39260_c0_seq1:47-895(+)
MRVQVFFGSKYPYMRARVCAGKPRQESHHRGALRADKRKTMTDIAAAGHWFEYFLETLRVLLVTFLQALLRCRPSFRMRRWRGHCMMCPHTDQNIESSNKVVKLEWRKFHNDRHTRLTSHSYILAHKQDGSLVRIDFLDPTGVEIDDHPVAPLQGEVWDGKTASELELRGGSGAGLSVRQLKAVAEKVGDQGPYHILRNNCHMVSRQIWNSLVTPEHRADHWPDKKKAALIDRASRRFEDIWTDDARTSFNTAIRRFEGDVINKLVSRFRSRRVFINCAEAD